MTRLELFDWLQSQLENRGIPTRRYEVEPGLEDLEVQLDGTAPVKLRIVRTGPR